MSESESTISTEAKYQEFLNMAVHELKTPVSVLKAYLQMITGQLQRDQQYGYMQTMAKMDVQLDKLLHLIADLQDGISPENDEIHCLMNDFSINESIRLCCDNATTTYPHMNIICETDPSDPVIRGDKDRIEQVIHNLITNGIKYAGDARYLKIVSTAVDGWAIISVTDKGPGIPPELQEKIFQRFYRVSSDTTRKQSGLGLGLFICAQIIRIHQGQIGVTHPQGMGAEFWFSLPVKEKKL